MAWLVGCQYQTKKPGAVLQFLFFSPRVVFQCRLSRGVCTASVCIGMRRHLGAHYKSLKLMFVISPSVSTQWHLSWLPLLCLCNEWIEIKTEREKCCVDFCTEFRIKEKH